MVPDLASILPSAAGAGPPPGREVFGRAGRAVTSGWPGLDRALRVEGAGFEGAGFGGAGFGGAGADGAGADHGRGLARGAVHEWIGVADADGAAGAGRAPWSPPVLPLAHLAAQAVADAAARGTGRAVVWIGRAVWPYPRVLGGGYGVLEVLGADDAQGDERTLSLELALHERAGAFSAGESELFARSLFVDVDGRDDADRRGGDKGPRRRRRGGAPRAGRKLWAIDTALRCPGVTAVVADGSGLDMAASRRLQLAAARSGALVLLARPPAERGEISAATTRWRVTREQLEPATDADDARARGVRWRAELLRVKGAQVLLDPDERTASGALHRSQREHAPTHQREAVQRGGTAPSHERSPCGASSPSTSPTSPSTSPSAAAPGPPAGRAPSPPPASS